MLYSFRFVDFISIIVAGSRVLPLYIAGEKRDSFSSG